LNCYYKKEERVQAEIDADKLKEYAVTVQFSGETTLRVWAESEKAAEEIARDDAGEPDDMEIDHVYVREMKN
jgi:hypothetical protein